MTTRSFVAPILVALFGASIITFPAHGQQRPTLSDDLLHHASGTHRHHVIVQAGDATLDALRGRGFSQLRRRMSGSVALDVTDAQLAALQSDPTVGHLSGDLTVTPDMAITNKVTGANAVWQGTSGLLSYTPGYDGTGITVAVVDSGIANHSALAGHVLTHVNLVSSEPGMTGDPYGHGTHVAAIVAGSTLSATKVTPAFAGGTAPGVKLVDVRVLDKNGSGLTSDVIAGIDWAIANRATYGIRIINLSLGHAVTEPSATDPLCQAVQRAVAMGMVVVTAAGNYGVTPDGAPVLGGITSPGNSPFAITVGAIDTNGTVDTSDDVVPAYSSKGPAKYELVVKPDLVAPGSHIVSAESAGSYLSTTYPQWHIAGTGSNSYFRLSGTSMATPVVSGGAALLLQAHRSLSPTQVKIALQMGARYIPSAGLQGAGAGVVNFAQSMKVAQSGLINNLLSTVSNLLGLSSGIAFRDDGSMTDRIYGGTGRRLLGILDLGALLNAGENGEWGVLNLLGLSNPLGSLPANRLVWGQVAGWTNNYAVVWGSSITSPSGQAVVWGSDTTDGQAFVWGSSVVDDGK